MKCSRVSVLKCAIFSVLQEHEEQVGGIAKERDEAVHKARTAEEHAASLVSSAVGAGGRSGRVPTPSSPPRQLLLPAVPASREAAESQAVALRGVTGASAGTAELRRQLIQVEEQKREVERCLRQRVCLCCSSVLLVVVAQ
jgi:hypothetical protein